MDHQGRRHPSSSVAVTDRSSIRHRSGTFSPTLRSRARHDSTAAHHDASNRSQPGIQIEDTDGRPTVLLVKKPRRSSQSVSQLASPTLPFHNGTVANVKSRVALAREAEYATLSARKKRDEPPAKVEESEDVPVYAPFSPIPLTPQQQQPPPQRQTHTRQPADELGFLPERRKVAHNARPKTPPVPPKSPTPPPPERQSLPSRLLSWRKPPAKRLDSEASHTSTSSSSTACTKESASDTSEHSAGPNAVRRYKRPLLYDADSAQTLGANSVLSTHSKLTKKFPISASVRKLSALGRGKVGNKDFAIVLLDESEGLGMERVDRWTGHKWFLFLSVCTTFAYGACALAYATLTWFKTWPNADVMLVSDYDVLVLITLFASLTLLTFVIGITGTLLNSRPLLAIYALLLWPTFIALLAVGYTSYKRAAFALDRKLNRAWSEWYTPYGRLVIQASLRCCGYYSPLHDASPSQECYARSLLPGCKSRLLGFERANLAIVWRAAFGVVPVHIVNMGVALLCANHVTRRFGKGIMPRQYRLQEEDLRADTERLTGVGGPGVTRPAVSSAPSSGVFREDKVDGNTVYRADPSGATAVVSLPYKHE